MLRKLVGFALLAMACSSDDDDGAGATFDIARYARSCMSAADCIVEFSGDPCGCSCELTAVSLSEKDRILSDRRKHMQSHCPNGPPQCGPCPAAPAVECRASLCELVP